METSLYLEPSRMRVGRLKDAPANSIVIAEIRGAKTPILVLPSGDRAIVLDGDGAWYVVTMDDHSPVRGVIIAGVRIEIDPTSGHTDRTPAKPGEIVMSGDDLALIKRGESTFDDEPVALTAGYPLSPINELYFSRWRVVHGEGDKSHALVEIDRSQA